MNGDFQWFSICQQFTINENGYVYRIHPDHHNVRIGEIDSDGFYEAYLNPKKKQHNCNYPSFTGEDLIQLGQLVNRFVIDRKQDKKIFAENVPK